MNAFLPEKHDLNNNIFVNSVPIHWKEDPALGSWVKNQRRCFLQQKMPKERLEKLEEIGFEFVVEPEGITWERGVKDLKEYKEKNGDCDVPSGYDESPQLLKWIHYQRELYRKGLLSGARKAELENLNFEWEHSMPSAHAPKKSAQEIWDMQLEKLKSFKSENGKITLSFFGQLEGRDLTSVTYSPQDIAIFSSITTKTRGWFGG